MCNTGGKRRQQKLPEGITSDFNLELNPNLCFITECGLMSDVRDLLWISILAEKKKMTALISLVTTLIHICTLYRNGCF